MTLKVRKLIVRLRMWYARIRGHKEHRWDYEPSEWYMGKHNKKNKEIPYVNARTIVTFYFILSAFRIKFVGI